jgi:hypothetical protein
MTKLPWLIGGFPLYVWLIGGAFGLILGFLAGLKWAGRRRIL